MIEEYNNISDVKTALINETIERFLEHAMMLTPADQAEHMAFLVKLAGAKKGIELGVFTGYTSLCFAEALPKDGGRLVAIDVSEEFTSLGKKYWEQAGVADRIELHLEGGIAVLDSLLAKEDERGTYDFAYVDADKSNYPNYFERLAELLRPGGFIMFDNVLWNGQVTNPETRKNDENTAALYGVVKKAQADARFKVHGILFSDGLAIAYKL